MSFDKDLLALQEVRDKLIGARAAADKLARMPQESLDRICEAMVRAGARHSEELAKLAVEESGFGRAESKVIKNWVGTELLWDYIKDKKYVGLIQEDRQNGYWEIGEPAGVVAAVIPITNPTSTAMFKIISALKAGCSIVVSPHPRGVRCVGRSCELLYQAALSAGAPEGSIGWLLAPTLESTQALMKDWRTSVIVATGGEGLVKAAYSSGNPAFGVGPGNAPAYIHSSADLERAVATIMHSQVFDWATICATENSVVVDQAIDEPCRAEFLRQGAYFCRPDEAQKLAKLLGAKGRGAINPDIVGLPPPRIAQMAGFSAPQDATCLIAVEPDNQKIGREYPLSLEKLAPVLGWFTVRDHVEAKDVCARILRKGGDGHTAAIHAKDERVILEVAHAMPAFRICVNGPTAQGSVGAACPFRPSMTLGCGTIGHNVTTDNIGPWNLVNIKRVGRIKPGYYEQRIAHDPNLPWGRATTGSHPAAAAWSNRSAPGRDGPGRDSLPDRATGRVGAAATTSGGSLGLGGGSVLTASDIEAIIARNTKAAAGGGGGGSGKY